MTSQKLGVVAAATRYVALLETETRLRRERNASACQHVAPVRDEWGTGGDKHPDGRAWEPMECWKTHSEQNDAYTHDVYQWGDGSSRGWCESCERRKGLHARLRAATKARAGALASLRAAVRRGEP